MALEKQFNESRKFIKHISKLLENLSTPEECILLFYLMPYNSIDHAWFFAFTLFDAHCSKETLFTQPTHYFDHCFLFFVALILICCVPPAMGNYCTHSISLSNRLSNGHHLVVKNRKLMEHSGISRVILLIGATSRLVAPRKLCKVWK